MFYNQADYIETASGNKVCRKSVLCGPQNIMILGKVSFAGVCFCGGTHIIQWGCFFIFRQSSKKAASSEEIWQM